MAVKKYISAINNNIELVNVSGGAVFQEYNKTIVYDNFLNVDEEWIPSNWGSQLQYVPRSQAAVDNMIQVTYTAGWGALYYYNLGGIDTTNLDRLTFQTYGVISPTNMICHLVGPGDDFMSGTRYEFTPYLGAWMTHVISLAQLGSPSIIKGIVIQNYTPTPGCVMYVDNMYFYNTQPIIPDDNIEEVTVNPNTVLFEVNEEIYGINHATPEMVDELDIPLTRWGGNGTTRYRWNIDTMTHINWFFQNIARGDGTNLPENNDVNRYLDSLAISNDQAVITVPMIGWWPKSRNLDVSYSVSKYGAQQQVAPENNNAGNGILLNGAEVVNDPTDASVQFNKNDIQTWVEHLDTRNSTKYIALDNEPMLWHETHKDVRQQGTAGVGYDELLGKTIDYATMIKSVNPDIKVFGPCSWGWVAYFWSGLDKTSGGSQWYNTRPDRMAHGDTPFLQWYLQQLHQYEIDNSQRLLDYLEVHFYPSAANVFNAAEGSPLTQKARLRSTKDLWDESYVSESYIGESVHLIPRMKNLIDTYYPGVKLCIGEYHFGSAEFFNGGLTQCEILAIFNLMGDKLDVALLWNSDLDFTENDHICTAFRLFRNYDGLNSRFGQFLLPTTVADRDKLTFIAAKNEVGDITAIAINKTDDDLTLDLTGITLDNAYRYTSASTSLQHIPIPDLIVPAMSATIYECSIA